MVAQHFRWRQSNQTFHSFIHSLIFSSLKMSSFLKSMLLLNFPIWWSSNWKKIKIIIQLYLNRYYLMIFIPCYNLVSALFLGELVIFVQYRSATTTAAALFPAIQNHNKSLVAVCLMSLQDLKFEGGCRIGLGGANF